MRNFYLLILSASVVALTGCAQPPLASPFEYPADPICFSERQCEAMWAQAPMSISNVTGMKVRMQSDTYIETYDGTRNPARLFGRVTKSPNPDGSYTIRSSVRCGVAGCGDLYLRAQALFNGDMHNAGSPFGKTTNPGADPGSVPR